MHSDDDGHAKCMQTHATMVVQYGVLHTHRDKLCMFKCCGRTQDQEIWGYTDLYLSPQNYNLFN